MQKTRDYEHHFVHQGAVGLCRVRVYEELGERPVVIATQQQAPVEAGPTNILSASRVIAADLIRDGTLSEFYMRQELIEKAIREGSARAIANVAPFVFVEEYLEPRHRIALLWFERYDVFGLIRTGETEYQIGNPIRADSTRQEVEGWIGASLDD
jgi:hypothetical protein